MTPEEHQAFIDRQVAVINESKQGIIDAALRAVAPRRVISDVGHAKELFINTVIKTSRPVFQRVAKIGGEFADVKK